MLLKVMLDSWLNEAERRSEKVENDSVTLCSRSILPRRVPASRGVESLSAGPCSVWEGAVRASLPACAGLGKAAVFSLRLPAAQAAEINKPAASQHKIRLLLQLFC